MGRYGVNIADANDVIEMAIGGKAVNQKYEGERKFDIRVRFSPEYRNSIEAIGKLLVPAVKGTSSKEGTRIPLREIADIDIATGTAFVYRETNQRFVQQKVNEEVKLDKGYTLAWNGEFENQVRATNQLKIVVPISILLIFFWLFIMFGSPLDAGIVLINVPFALIGGILGLYLTGINFSISAGVGFIALFGVCVQNGVILVSIFNHNMESGMEKLKAIREGALTRVRPVIMTALMAGLGLLPAALSTGIGSETQRPLAVVVIGGLISATILTLLILPVIYLIMKKSKDSQITPISINSKEGNENEII
jgi:heavy metal efflux system protein